MGQQWQTIHATRRLWGLAWTHLLTRAVPCGCSRHTEWLQVTGEALWGQAGPFVRDFFHDLFSLASVLAILALLLNWQDRRREQQQERKERKERRKQLKALRRVIVVGERRVLGAKSIRAAELNRAMGVTQDMSDAVVRAEEYNKFLRRLGTALTDYTPQLSPLKKQAVYDAVDWDNLGETDEMYVVPRSGVLAIPHLPSGRWPTSEMSLEDAQAKFTALRGLRWLKLDDVPPSA